MQAAALDRVERIAHARGSATVGKKVAALLAALCDTLSPPRTRIDLPAGLQQRDMAKLLGVRHESFCRALARLHSHGVISKEGGVISILDRDALS